MDSLSSSGVNLISFLLLGKERKEIQKEMEKAHLFAGFIHNSQTNSRIRPFQREKNQKSLHKLGINL